MDPNIQDLFSKHFLLFPQYFRKATISGFFNPLPDDKFRTLFKLKEFADDNFKFDENGRKLSKQVENTVGKWEIARYEQFLLFPHCFQKAYFPGRQKASLCGNGLKSGLCGKGLKCPTIAYSLGHMTWVTSLHQLELSLLCKLSFGIP